MKLATLQTGGRDGTLVVVSRDNRRCRAVPDIAPTLQHALDRWAAAGPRLTDAFEALDGDPDAGTAFVADDAHCPLPRAYQWVDGSAYVNHVELVRRARGAELPASFWEDPLVYQGGSDDFVPPAAPAMFGDEAWGIDFEAEVAVITDDVPMGVCEADAGEHVKLVMLVNDWSLRNLIPAELAKGFGFYQAKPATSFSPIAVTPDELGPAWFGSKLKGALASHVNGLPFGTPDAGVDMTFSFARLIAHVARTRRLGAGSIVGSGTVSNKDGDSPGKPVGEGGLGYSCVAELRMIETIQHGAPRTPFLRFGDRVRIEMTGRDGSSIFGAIDQQVTRA